MRSCKKVFFKLKNWKSGEKQIELMLTEMKTRFKEL